MKDEEKLCQCGHPHPWGIVGKSEDGVPLYGSREIPTCTEFRPVVEQLPAGVDGAALMAATDDLDAQASLQTRIVVSRIRELGKSEPRYARMAAQWPVFMDFVIGEMTRMRGAMTRDESKFGHLVAHTDEIVEAMRGVAQLSERLKMQEVLLSRIAERLDDMEYNRVEQMEMAKDYAEDEALRHFGLVEPDEPDLFDPKRWTPSRPEEPVLVEKANGPDDDESEESQDDESDDENGNGDDEAE